MGNIFTNAEEQKSRLVFWGDVGVAEIFESNAVLASGGGVEVGDGCENKHVRVVVGEKEKERNIERERERLRWRGITIYTRVTLCISMHRM